MKRRAFILTTALAGAGTAWHASPAVRAAGGLVPGPASTTPHQSFHPDYVNRREGVEYYFLGNGLIQAAVQSAESDDAGTHCGLLVWDPEHFCRKASTFLYHPERGLENTRIRVAADGVSHAPKAGSARIEWAAPGDTPSLRITWHAGPLLVEERIRTPEGVPALLREIAVTNTGENDSRCTVIAPLYPNLMLFDEYAVDRRNAMLTASGFSVLRLFCREATGTGDRHLAVERTLKPRESLQATFILTVGMRREAFERIPPAVLSKRTDRTVGMLATIETGLPNFDHVFRRSVHGIRAAVARSGKMDGSIWQYNMEWVRDQSMTAAAAAMAGDTALSAAMLERLLMRCVDRDGGTTDASRRRPIETTELDQNGELLFALWAHWVWSGDDGLLRKHREKILALGMFPTRPEVYDAETGMVHNVREFWERDAAFGVRDGFEIAYQAWNIRGWECLADIAAHLGESATTVSRIRGLAERMRTSLLSHPRFPLVDEGRFIKRRLLGGEIQRVLEPLDRSRMPTGMPIAVESVPLCDPDSSAVLPIVLGITGVEGPVARATLESMETLWNQRWQGGGYGRYHVSSEPDSPGPWPFPSVIIARAALEMGDGTRARKVIDWLAGTQGGKAGAWWEFYGDRPTPPLPPVGITPWTWAEIVMLGVTNLLGVRPQTREIVIRPRALAGVRECRTALTIRGVRYRMHVFFDGRMEMRVDGRKIPAENGIFRLPYARSETVVECHA
ncbi:MAG: hypothetical protein QHI48_09795 [Bacteroidota bacterium]|nr:hypothetical protein [Bacteroidota bacterium]